MQTQARPYEVEAVAPHDVEMVRRLVALLRVQPVGTDVFIGGVSDEPWQATYGGQILGQALAAAQASLIDERLPHSLHAYFLRPGSADAPITYHVSRDRDGRGFSSRRVLAEQAGRTLATLSVSFQRHEEGLRHQVAAPQVRGPKGLATDRALKTANRSRIPEHLRFTLDLARAVEFRPVEEQDPAWPGAGALLQHHWFRIIAPLPREPALHRAILAYLSDYVLVGVAVRAHGKMIYDWTFQASSLDHALWFHDDVEADQWLLYAQESPWTGQARGLSRGLIFSQDGRLVASVVQEALLRNEASRASPTPGTAHAD